MEETRSGPSVLSVRGLTHLPPVSVLGVLLRRAHDRARAGGEEGGGHGPEEIGVWWTSPLGAGPFARVPYRSACCRLTRWLICISAFEHE